MFQRFFGRSERPDKGAGALPARLTFDGFLHTSPGRLLLEWEAEAYDELTVDVFGSCALQIGMPELNTLAENRMQSKWLIELQSAVSVSADVLSGDLGCIVAAPELLPIADESMDLVTLPHVLELSPNPQQALHEAVRVLEPEGRLILTAFNGAGFGGCGSRPSGSAPSPICLPTWRRFRFDASRTGLRFSDWKLTADASDSIVRDFAAHAGSMLGSGLTKPATDGCRNAQIFFCSPLLSGVPERESSTAANLPIFQLKYRPQACRPLAVSRQLSPKPPSHRPHRLRKTIKHHDSRTYTYCS